MSLLGDSAGDKINIAAGTVFKKNSADPYSFFAQAGHGL